MFRFTREVLIQEIFRGQNISLDGARELRYNFFLKRSEKNKYDFIATASSQKKRMMS